MQLATPLAESQGVQDAPHEETDVSGAHWEPHRWKPALQTKSQAVLLQVAVALAGVTHAAQPPPQNLKPGLQVIQHD